MQKTGEISLSTSPALEGKASCAFRALAPSFPTRVLLELGTHGFGLQTGIDLRVRTAASPPFPFFLPLPLLTRLGEEGDLRSQNLASANRLACREPGPLLPSRAVQ
jgi:hypothetical protein